MFPSCCKLSSPDKTLPLPLSTTWTMYHKHECGRVTTKDHGHMSRPKIAKISQENGWARPFWIAPQLSTLTIQQHPRDASLKISSWYPNINELSLRSSSEHHSRETHRQAGWVPSSVNELWSTVLSRHLSDLKIQFCLHILYLEQESALHNCEFSYFRWLQCFDFVSFLHSMGMQRPVLQSLD